MESGCIDWEDLRKGYNRIYKRRYVTVKDMLNSLYKKEQSLTKLSNILGPSIPTISTKLKSLEIKVNGHGGKNHKPIKKTKFLNIPDERLAKMSKIEIMNETGLSRSYLEILISRYKRKIRLLPESGGRHYAN